MTTTPAYVVKLNATGGYYSPTAWPTRHCGRPNDDNLAAYVASFERATKPGGVNAHLGQVRVNRAQIIRQASGEVVASYKRAA